MARQMIVVQGSDDVLQALTDAVEAALPAIRAATEEETEEVAADMRSSAPVDQGDLRDSIETDVVDTDGRVSVGADHRWFVEAGTSSAPAQPYALPAAERSRGRFPDRVEKAIKGTLP